MSLPFYGEKCSEKLLIVGQETLVWGSGSIKNYESFYAEQNNVSFMMDVYKNFAYAQVSKNYNSPFWKTFRMLATNRQALWSNVFRFSVTHDIYKGYSVIKNTTAEERAVIYAAQRGLLKAEIEILKPQAVIFFTGPYYDEAIVDEFEDVQRSEVEGFNMRSFAHLKAKGLPWKSYRLYHPNYLYRKKLYNDWIGHLNLLIEST